MLFFSFEYQEFKVRVNYLEIVMNEMRKNQNFHFDLQIHPTLINSTYLHCQMTGFIPIRVQNFQNVE